MRTKTLLLGAATLAAGVVTSLAANTYSVNVVGYINVTVQPGYNLIANQLDIDGVDAISTVLDPGTPSSQDGAFTLKFHSGAYNQDFYDGTGNTIGFIGWYDGITGNPSTNTVAPGTGFFYFNPTGSAATLTLTGTVLQGTNSIPLPAGYSLDSVVVPEAITLDTTATNNFPVADGAFYLSYTNVGHGGNYATQDFYDATGNTIGFVGWYDGITGNQVFPTPAVGQGFFYFNTGSATTWSRNFSVQ
jgi:hypothetical protein